MPTSPAEVEVMLLSLPFGHMTLLPDISLDVHKNMAYTIYLRHVLLSRKCVGAILYLIVFVILCNF